MDWAEKRELVRVAKLYYFQGLTQAEISKKIGVSRPVISKLLQKAKDAGIVEIIIKDETVNVVEIEQKLEEMFSLDEAIVVPVNGIENQELIKQLVAKEAAMHLSKLAKNVKSIGLSWGTTLYHMVNEYPYERNPEMMVYPLVGGTGRKHVEIHSNQLAYELSKRMGANCEFLYAPALVETVDLKEQILQSESIRVLLDQIRKVEIALLGIGFLEESTLFNMGYLKEEEMEELKQNQAVGDIGSRFIDKDGKQIHIPLNNRVIGIDLPDLFQIPTVIAVATGLAKVTAIRAALRGGYFHKLFVDERTARELIAKSDEKGNSEE
ncbi:sugar-binding transcriptional regulator [Brevibacillus laterosporus]|uniref:Sugar-binding transcriptional regulator n=1 Tax=Brevibacillus halotolerans TaxID=1507437 RepID=A0ABT4HYQ5_9BACL|nr:MULTISPECIES: sugar-binding transcriptional regulator [Brevibacillus]MCR8986209.1 sugar-binding transcriptional regulator [Brevibacillus laterosporus]MCZ0831942.1 sugar-binding transcriptional regulator [Brevibacillus halotolerans]